MPRIEIIESRCKGCGLCTTVCPKGIVSMGVTLNTLGYTPATCIDMSKCTGCTFCAQICPDVAIVVFR